jgi:DNA-binding CsgD family transcriptional regulator
VRDEFQEKRLRSFYRIGEFDFMAQNFLVEGFLPKGGLVILAGDPKIGKTAVASAIALAVAKGKPFAGMKTLQSAVLWLQLEESYQERSAIMRAARGFKRLPFYACFDHVPIDTDEGIADLDAWRSDTNARLIVVDPLHAAHSGRSLADGWAARKTLAKLKAMCTATRTTALVLHHLMKSRSRARLAESVQLAAVATMVMILTIASPAGARPRTIRLDCTGRGAYANRSWTLESRGPLDYRIADSVAPSSGLTTLQRSVLSALETGPKSAQTIADALCANVRSVRNAITFLKYEGCVSSLRKIAKTQLYRLKKPPKCPHKTG